MAKVDVQTDKNGHEVKKMGVEAKNIVYYNILNIR